jgi:hypothetical protein
MIIRDDSPMPPSHHYYWEIKVSHMKYRYASDGWFGVGTNTVTQLDATNLMNNSTSRDNFWGYGSNGTVSHNNQVKQYGPHFHEGDTLGAHLNLYHGTLEFHRNKKPLGIAFTGLPKNITMYPILIGATAISTPSEMEGPHKFLPSLQLSCYQRLAKVMMRDDLLRIVPPGLVQLVDVFNFLHYCTGEEANPGQYSNKFEMVIVSDNEEENWVSKRQRRQRRRNAHVDPHYSPTLSDSDDDENWANEQRIQQWNQGRPLRIDEPSCSNVESNKRRGKSHTDSQNNKISSACQKKTRSCPKKNQPLNSNESVLQSVSSQKISQSKTSSARQAKSVRKHIKNREPLNTNESVLQLEPSSTKSQSSFPAQRKSRRLLNDKNTKCGCLGC